MLRKPGCIVRVQQMSSQTLPFWGMAAQAADGGKKQLDVLGPMQIFASRPSDKFSQVAKKARRAEKG